MRKSSPATYCMRSCCWQQPSSPTTQPKRMMETAMPTKPAVILRRSVEVEGRRTRIRMMSRKVTTLPYQMYMPGTSLKCIVKFWVSQSGSARDTEPDRRIALKISRQDRDRKTLTESVPLVLTDGLCDVDG